MAPAVKSRRRHDAAAAIDATSSAATFREGIVHGCHPDGKTASASKGGKAIDYPSPDGEDSVTAGAGASMARIMRDERRAVFRHHPADSLIDPPGNVPLVVSALKNVAPERRVRSCCANARQPTSSCSRSWWAAVRFAVAASRRIADDAGASFFF
jgi:hypothetical protein